MATRPKAEDVNIRIVSETDEIRSETAPDAPFCVALLGDFSGRGSRGIVETGGNLSARRIYQIDRDNFSEVLSRLQVELRMPLLGPDSPPVVLRFSDLDDFHPDRVFDRVEAFDALKETRQSLKDPAIVAAIAKQVATAANPAESVPAAKSSQPSGNLLQQIIDAAEDCSSVEGARPPSAVEDFVRQTARPYSVPKAHPVQLELLAKVDRAIGELMRKFLHHPDFQALEAAWRGLHFLVSNLETDENLKLYLIDISKAELAADMGANDDISKTEICKLLWKTTTETGDPEPWSLLAGDFTFDNTSDDAALLSGLSNLAKAVGAPFIAAAHPRLLGCDSLAATPDPDDWKLPVDSSSLKPWAALRKLPEAAYMGLALPRFLLRLPYGKETEPIERFEFEELEAVPKHDHYLWGNPCYACVYLIAQAFSQHGWNFRPGMIQEIGGLPLHVFKDQGESSVKPCAETMLTQRAAEAILDRGLMPLLSFVNQDNVRLARFQSIADPPTPLKGRWV
jgi:type VI secretion system protein ImpC